MVAATTAAVNDPDVTSITACLYNHHIILVYLHLLFVEASNLERQNQHHHLTALGQKPWLRMNPYTPEDERRPGTPHPKEKVLPRGAQSKSRAVELQHHHRHHHHHIIKDRQHHSGEYRKHTSQFVAITLNQSRPSSAASLSVHHLHDKYHHGQKRVPGIGKQFNSVAV